jgi:hypothetical protein
MEFFKNISPENYFIKWVSDTPSLFKSFIYVYTSKGYFPNTCKYLLRISGVRSGA